jgi:hypothetical protein
MNQDCSTTLSASVRSLVITTTLVQLWKSATAKGLKHTNPLNKPFVIKRTPSSHYSPDRTSHSPAPLAFRNHNHCIQHIVILFKHVC